MKFKVLFSLLLASARLLYGLPDHVSQTAHPHPKAKSDQVVGLEQRVKGNGKEVSTIAVKRQGIEAREEAFVVKSSGKAEEVVEKKDERRAPQVKTKASDLLDLTEAVVVGDPLPLDTSVSSESSSN